MKLRILFVFILSTLFLISCGNVEYYVNSGQYDSARRICEREKDPENQVKCYLYLGDLLAEREVYDKAGDAYATVGYDNRARKMYELAAHKYFSETNYLDAAYYFNVIGDVDNEYLSYSKHAQKKSNEAMNLLVKSESAHYELVGFLQNGNYSDALGTINEIINRLKDSRDAFSESILYYGKSNDVPADLIDLNNIGTASVGEAITIYEIARKKVIKAYDAANVAINNDYEANNLEQEAIELRESAAQLEQAALDLENEVSELQSQINGRASKQEELNTAYTERYNMAAITEQDCAQYGTDEENPDLQECMNRARTLKNEAQQLEREAKAYASETANLTKKMKNKSASINQKREQAISNYDLADENEEKARDKRKESELMYDEADYIGQEIPSMVEPAEFKLQEAHSIYQESFNMMVYY